jgi:hypothetical protein
MAEYTGASIVDYLKSVGKPSDYTSRSKLASEKGIGEYRGTATQNTQLLNMLRGGGEPSSTPTTQEQVAPYLSNFQKGLFDEVEKPKVKVPTMEELKTELAPEVDYPEPLGRVEKFEELRLEYGLADLEKSLSDIKAEIDEEFALLRQQRGIEEGKPVPMGVIAGRISEEERTAQERIDFLGRQKTRITDELNTKYSLVNTYMNLMGLDYDDAVNRYDTEFKNNVTMYNIISGKEEAALTQLERDRTAARSNLQIYVNAITGGNLTYADMSADQKLMINKLEVQSGLPSGFISNLKMSVNDRLVSVNDKTGEALMVDENGNFNVVQTGMTPTPASGDTKVTEQDYKEALTEDVRESKNLDSLMKFYSTYLDPKYILKIYDINSPFGKHKETDKQLEKYGL